MGDDVLVLVVGDEVEELDEVDEVELGLVVGDDGEDVLAGVDEVELDAVVDVLAEFDGTATVALLELVLTPRSDAVIVGDVTVLPEVSEVPLEPPPPQAVSRTAAQAQLSAEIEMR